MGSPEVLVEECQHLGFSQLIQPTSSILRCRYQHDENNKRGNVATINEDGGSHSWKTQIVFSPYLSLSFLLSGLKNHGCNCIAPAGCSVHPQEQCLHPSTAACTSSDSSDTRFELSPNPSQLARSCTLPIFSPSRNKTRHNPNHSRTIAKAPASCTARASARTFSAAETVLP